MQLAPRRLNQAIAGLFAVGSACFVLGSVSAYADAVGASADAITYFIGSLFFTTASGAQLVQAQTPGATDVDASTQRRSGPAVVVRVTVGQPVLVGRRGPVPRNPVLQRHDLGRHRRRLDAAPGAGARVAARLPRLGAVPRVERRRDAGGAPRPHAAPVPHLGLVDRRAQPAWGRSPSWCRPWPLGSSTAPRRWSTPAWPTPARWSGPSCFFVGALLMLPAWQSSLHAGAPAA